MKYVTPSIVIFGMSFEDVETFNFFRSSGEGIAETINFLESFRVKKGSGSGSADEINYGDHWQ